MTDRYVIASVQNYSEVVRPALDVLMTYTEMIEAELHLLPLSYNTREKDDFGYDFLKPDMRPEYDPLIEDIILWDTLEVNKNLIIMPGIHTRPTTKDQLSGMHTISKDKSAIFAGVRHRSLPIATPGQKLPKLLMTTPTITRPKYSPSSSGTTAKAMHEVGAIVIEVQDDHIFHARQLTINDNFEIYDLGLCYTAFQPPRPAKTLGVILGDLHQLWADPSVVRGTFTNEDSIIRTLSPEIIAVHDFIDFYSSNHHHVGDRLLEYLKQKHGLNNIHQELIQAMEFIHEVTPAETMAYIVPSNHCDALDRWLNSGRGDNDPVNAPLYHLLNYCRYTNAELMGPAAFTTNPLEDFAKHFCPETLDKVRFMHRGDSLHIGDHECGFHGDRGPSGSRGNLKGMSNLGVPVLMGHAHGPQRFNNNGQVGTSSLLNMGYNGGEPSNWLHTHAVINEDHSWTLINVIGEDWRGRL